MKTLQNIKALILDMDGVLWRGNESIGDLPTIFEAIAARGLKVTLATNNSTRTPEAHLQKLASFGVKLDVLQVLSSSMATAALLKEDFPAGGDLYIVGLEGIFRAVEAEGFRVFTESDLPKNPVAVVSGIDWEITYEKIANAALLIRNGAPYYATNPDKTFPTPQGLMPGAGTILAAIETASGVAPIVAGKPQPYLFQLAMQRMGVLPEETLMVGDRLETDVLGGQNADCKTALVLSGVTTRADGEAWLPKPDIIAENLAQVLEML
ncbi:MAG: HAD-IIA family hydrolase [Anaerolineae bacterium]|jgi:4-nitrophenyl phosphatase|nr:HAD-IIA family hydrolase [Anaerolineae bacterium]MBT7070996.1 HAD-IIA family hydrolase [Anaerolineae bacterium]MBT7325162.1 HAD-IIA family hydrolase [Anaerolineae bacterium]